MMCTNTVETRLKIATCAVCSSLRKVMLYWISRKTLPSCNASLNAKMLSSLQLTHHRTRCHVSIVPASRAHLSLLFSFAMCNHGFTIPVRFYQRPPSRVVERKDRLVLADIVLALFFQCSGFRYT